MGRKKSTRMRTINQMPTCFIRPEIKASAYGHAGLMLTFSSREANFANFSIEQHPKSFMLTFGVLFNG